MTSPEKGPIKVIGVGGGGGNAVEHMIREKVQNEFIVRIQMGRR